MIRIANVWLKNKMTIVVSDNHDQHQETLKRLCDKDGKVMDDHVRGNDLGQVIINQSTE